MPPPPTRTEQHDWLQQLVGEWTVSIQGMAEAGMEPTQSEHTESVRPVGELWIVGEGSASFGGKSFTSVMTLGYDSQKQRFVGTWVDTMLTHMWVYTGHLDEAKRVLTLEADGPRFDDPTKTAKYRDTIELVSPDHKVLTSSMQTDDGSWTTFMRADYRRKAK